MASSSTPRELHIANFLRLASGDLEDARSLRKTGSRNAAYHAEQAAEKVVLALLTSEDIQVQRKDHHRLDVLADLVPPENPFRERLRALSFLTAFATTYRYPKPGGRIPPEPPWREIDDALGRIAGLLAEIAVRFGVDLDASDASGARFSSPLRK
jgi:HEPN domain-containing protein